MKNLILLGEDAIDYPTRAWRECAETATCTVPSVPSGRSNARTNDEKGLYEPEKRS